LVREKFFSQNLAHFKKKSSYAPSMNNACIQSYKLSEVAKDHPSAVLAALPWQQQ